MKITERHERILDLLCQSFSFASSSDRHTVITKEQCKKPTQTILELKSEILRLYPKEYTKKLVSGATGDKANLTQQKLNTIKGPVFTRKRDVPLLQ